MIQAIKIELSTRKSELENEIVDTIYFGGGTPSLLSQNDLSEIFTAIHKNYCIDEQSEITLESNPDDLTKEKLKILYEAGVNRLSIGIQSFNDNILHQLNRSHTSSESINALHLSRDIGFDNISIDLIFGMPGLNIELWEKTLDHALDFNVGHISCYNLTIEEKTALWHFVNNNKIHLPPDQNQKDQFLFAHNYLNQNSYDHYEISNYAQNGFQSKHNSNYWNRTNYLGIGPSAHSYYDNNRRWNSANNTKYIKAINSSECYSESEKLTDIDNFNEYIMLALRQKTGIIKTRLKEFSYSKNDAFTLNILSLLAKNLLCENEHSFYLTPEQFYLSDHICSELFIVNEN